MSESNILSAMHAGLSALPDKDLNRDFDVEERTDLIRIYDKSEHGHCLMEDIYLYKDNHVKLSDDSRPLLHASSVGGANHDQWGFLPKMILFQGPTDKQIDDTLRMFTEQNIRLVVNCVMKKDIPNKCWDYWSSLTSLDLPDWANKLFDPTKFGDEVTLQFLETQDKQGEAFRFLYLHIKNWIDQSVPKDPDMFLNFMRLVRGLDEACKQEFSVSDKTEEAGLPMLAIHCTAGVGRSGTLAYLLWAVHILINNPEKLNNMDARQWMKDILILLRSQRAQAVYKLIQYFFCREILKTVVGLMIKDGQFQI